MAARQSIGSVLFTDEPIQVKTVLVNQRKKGKRLFSFKLFLDHVKHVSDIPTDYKLAQALGLKQSTVSGWRCKNTLPSVPAVVKLCALSGDDPALIAVLVLVVSSRDEVSQKLWLSVEKRLRKARQIDAMATIDAIELEAFE